MALSRLLRHCDRSRSNVIREFFWVWLDRTTHMKSKASRTRTIMRRTISRIRHRNLNMAIRRWRVCCLRSREETILQRLRRSSTSRSVCAFEISLLETRAPTTTLEYRYEMCTAGVGVWNGKNAIITNSSRISTLERICVVGESGNRGREIETHACAKNASKVDREKNCKGLL